MARKLTNLLKAEPKVAKKTGYDPLDLMKAPVEPPTPEDTEEPDTGQTLSIAIGAALVAIGFIGWLALGSKAILFLVIVGVVCVIAGTLVKTHPKD